MRINLVHLAFVVSLSLLAGCGGPEPSTGSDGDSASGASQHVEVDMAASGDTQAWIGVQKWRVSQSGAVGYDSADREVASFQFQRTEVSSNETQVAVELHEGGRDSKWRYTALALPDGRRQTLDFQESAPDPARTLETIKLMVADYERAMSSASTLASSALSPLTTPNLVKEGGSCTVVLACGHVVILKEVAGSYPGSAGFTATSTCSCK